MPTQISGSTGVSKVQDGVVVTADIADLAITPEKMSQKMTLMQSVDVTTLSGKTKCDFTGIPSWVKRITVMFSGVRFSSPTAILIQLGDSGGIENTDYLSLSTEGTTLTADSYTTGFAIKTSSVDDPVVGSVVITPLTSNTWIASGTLARSAAEVFVTSAGSKTLSDVLTQVRITSVNARTITAGTINVLYEG